jgi:hypothetical protein
MGLRAVLRISPSRMISHGCVSVTDLDCIRSLEIKLGRWTEFLT